LNRLAPLLLLVSLLCPPALAESWLTYDRSGGFTGWSLKVAVDAEGRFAVVGTRQDPKSAEPVPLPAAELAELQRLVKRALAEPARTPRENMRHLADGMQRLLTVQDGEQGRLLVLSDGYRLAEGDRKLIAALEALAQRQRKDEPAEASPPIAKPPRVPPIDLIVVGAREPAADKATALLLELPLGRADEPAGRAGAIELLLLSVLGPQAEVLLAGGPEVRDPDTGRWSLEVTAARTRLLVVLEDLPPAALRGTSARLRRLVQRAEPTLAQVGFAELDHHRRRLADAVHDREGRPRARREVAARRAAWGARAGTSPSAFSVTAIEREDLAALARKLRAGHARLLAAGPLARNAISLCSRGFERRARGPITAVSPAPEFDGQTAPTNERLLATGITVVSQGLPGALALELARRRHPSTWLERLEPGSSRLAVPGDTLLLVAPGGALRDEATIRLRRTLERLSAGVTQGAIDTRLRRRSLGNRSHATALVREAADRLELGAPHPGSRTFDVSVEPAAVDVADVRAAAAALADSLTDVPAGPPARERPALLETAIETLLGGLEPSGLELTGLRNGEAESLSVDFKPDLALRLETPSEKLNLEAGRLPAGATSVAGPQQARILAALTEPALLVAGAAAGLFPVREAPGTRLRADGKRRRCGVLEVLVPARGLFRVFIDRKTGDAWAVDRLDPLGRTTRLLMSDIQEFPGGRRTASRRVLVGVDGERSTQLESAELHLGPR